MALPPITPPGSPSIQPLTGGPVPSGLATPPQTPPQTLQMGGVIDFSKIPSLSLNKKEVEPPAEEKKAAEDKGGFQRAMGTIAKDTWMIPGLSAVTGGIADGKPGVGGALKGAAGGVVDVTENNLKSLKSIPTSPTQALAGAVGTNIENSKTAPDWAKTAAKIT